MQWENLLLYKCREIMFKGGEVHIQFSKRKDEVIPIIRTYPDNQTICDAVKIEDEFIK